MHNNLDIEILSWGEKVEEIIANNNPIVYELIKDSITKKDEFMLASYHYGDGFLNAGKLHLPLNDGGTVPYIPENFSSSVRKFIGDGYALLPFGLVVKGYFDVYWKSSDKVIPRGGLTPGVLCGTRELVSEPKNFNFKNAWNVSSGSRTLALLPSIKDEIRFKSLNRHYNIGSTIPQSFNDHFDLFKSLYQASDTQWKSTLLFFSEKLVQKLSTRKNFKEFREYIYKWFMDATCFDRNKSSFEFIWEQFIRHLEKSGVKKKVYIYNIAKYLLLVALGEEFAFTPATTDNVAPVSFFQQAFTDHYKLAYSPSLIHSTKLNKAIKGEALYYSLQYPIHQDPFPTKNSAATGVDDIRELKELHQWFFEFIESPDGTCARESIISNITDNTNFEYFHTVQDHLKYIATSQEVTALDPRLSKGSRNGKGFCHASTFFKGCVKVQNK